jgi:hypothetical protein
MKTPSIADWANAEPKDCANCGQPYKLHSEQTKDDAGELCRDPDGDEHQRYAELGGRDAK